MGVITHAQALGEAAVMTAEPRVDDPPGPHEISRTVATRLRELRKQRGWSLDRAALQTGVSKAMLGQIERGESSPTVATLWKIAGGFACSLTSFLVDAAEPCADSRVHNAAAARAKPASDDMLVAPIFAYDPRFAFELLELTLLPGYVRLSEPHTAGVTEHVIVLQGRMDLMLAGQWKSLAPGDAVRFAADKPHGYRNLGDSAAVCLNLIHYAVTAPHPSHGGPPAPAQP